MTIFFCFHFIVNENILQNEKESYNYTVKPVFKGHPCGVGHIGYSGIFGNQPLHMQFMQRTKVDVSVRFT